MFDRYIKAKHKFLLFWMNWETPINMSSYKTPHTHYIQAGKDNQWLRGAHLISYLVQNLRLNFILTPRKADLSYS